VAKKKKKFKPVSGEITGFWDPSVCDPVSDLTGEAKEGDELCVQYVCRSCSRRGVVFIRMPDTGDRLFRRVTNAVLMEHSVQNLLCDKEGFELHVLDSGRID
jgi:hypothetical protein